MQKKALFMVGSSYQLMNAISVRLTECPDAVCDLILRSATVWDPDMLARLEQAHIFRRICCPDLTHQEKSFWSLPAQRQLAIYNDPLMFLGSYPVDTDYDSLYMAVIHNSWRLIYQYQVMQGKRPKVFLFDEGIRAYTLDIAQYDEAGYLQGSYAKAPLTEAIEAFYLFQPELYTIENPPYELRPLRGIRENPAVKEALIRVFGYGDMPAEPYVYLEDYFFADRHMANDFQLFQQFSEIVGRENIIVKRHPRCTDDRFVSAGYKTVSHSMVPWEIQLMCNNLRGKILISVSSTALLTPFIIFDSDMHVISLDRMYVGDDLVHQDEGFSVFFDKLTKKVNADETHFHTPATMEELREVLRYITLVQDNP